MRAVLPRSTPATRRIVLRHEREGWRVEEVYAALYGAGIDGLFSDFTALNVAARDKYWASVRA